MKTLVPAVAIAVVCLMINAAPSHAQLFGGGGLLGGGGGGFGGGGLGGGGFGGGGFGGGPPIGGGFGGGRPMIGGGPPIGGGGFGGGPMIGGGAPMVRPSLPIAQPVIPAAPRPVLGGGPIAGGGRPIANLPGPGLGNRPIVNQPVLGDRPLLGNQPVAGNRPIAGDLPNISNRPVFNTPSLPGNNLRPVQPVNRDRLNDFLDNKPAVAPVPSPINPPVVADRPLLDRQPGGRPLVDRPLGDRPIVNQPIMPSLGEAVLKDEVRKELVGRHIERAVHVRERIRDLYYRENHPIAYWRNYMWEKHPVWSWWNVTRPNRWADWSSVSSWCGYSSSYAQPMSYEYTDQGVYANGQQVNVDDGYSQQARELAAAGKKLLQAKVDAQEAGKLEWLPLGVYALCKSEAGDPTMFLQLAISREGIIAGSFANSTNNENLSIQGGADRESSRIAITIGDTDDVVVETGLNNITEEQASALVHYQNNTRENWLLVKMPESDSAGQATASGSSSGTN